MSLKPFRKCGGRPAPTARSWRVLSSLLGAWKAVHIITLGLHMSWLMGCAKVGEPQPPLVRIPKPAVDLTARQISDSVVLQVSMPVRNTDGSEVSTLDSVQVLRLAEDKKDSRRPQPLPQKEFINRASTIISIPASRIPDYLQDKTIVIRDTPPFRSGSSGYSNALRYGVLFVNNRNEAAGLSNQAFIEPVAIPLPPSELASEVSEHFIRLTWLKPQENMDGSKPARIEGYNVFRAENPAEFPPSPLNSDPLPDPEYADRDFLFDKTYYYAVKVIGSLQNPYAESLLSVPHTVVTKDKFPPDPPQKLSAISENGIVILLWVAPESRDIAGYLIFRLDEGADAPIPLQDEVIHTLSFRDSSVEPERTYEYEVVSVDSHGNKSDSVRVKVKVR